MAVTTDDFVEETTLTAGSGPFLLAGNTLGNRRFSDAFSYGTTQILYCIADYPSGANKQVVAGTLTTDGVSRYMSVDTVYTSTAYGGPVSFGVGLKRLFTSIPASLLLPAIQAFPVGKLNGSGDVITPFTTVLPYAASSDLGVKTVTGPLPFSVAPVGSIRGGQAFFTLVTDGVNTPTWTGIVRDSSSIDYPTAANIVVRVYTWFDGLRYYYSYGSDDAQTPYVPVTFGIYGTAQAGTLGTAYTFTYTTANGVAPVTFAVFSGTLPAGLSLNTSTGVLSGTPTTAATSTFVIRATDSSAQTAYTATQSVVVSAGAIPGVPTGLVATPGNAQASVAFTPGSPVGTSYTVTASTGQTATGSASPIVVTGLSNNVAVNFVVTATNSSGTSAGSAGSAPVTPTNPVTIVIDTLAGFTQSGSGPYIYTATNSGGSGSFTNQFGVSTSQTLASTVVGGLQMVVNDITSGADAGIGLSVENGNNVFTNWNVLVVKQAGTYKVYEAGTQTYDASTGGGPAPAVNDVVNLIRNTAGHFVFSVNGTVLFTSTATATTGLMYFKITANAAGVVKTLQRL